MAMFTRQYRIVRTTDGDYRIQWSFVGVFWNTLEDPDSSYGREWKFRNSAHAEETIQTLLYRQNNPEKRKYK